jgi:hypothetical protein
MGQKQRNFDFLITVCWHYLKSFVIWWPSHQEGNFDQLKSEELYKEHVATTLNLGTISALA